MSSIAVIPARGGSKRIPRKNIRLFAGKPMIAWSIEAARLSNVFDRVIVSTDDDEISSLAFQFGAEVPFRRPLELADDLATTDAVFIHAIRAMQERAGDIEFACCLYATAPFVQPEDLRAGLETIRVSQATSAFSVVKYDYPVFRSLKINDKGRVELFWPEHRLTRSQDLPQAYHDAGQFYFVNVARYLAEKSIFSSDAVPIIIPSCRARDIDTLEDWEVAELMFKTMEVGKQCNC
jgi:pseudaminic acid cytidylyltransferase